MTFHFVSDQDPFEVSALKNKSFNIYTGKRSTASEYIQFSKQEVI